jgi:predicted alpha-1,6-mannanase (GH76 family)
VFKHIKRSELVKNMGLMLKERYYHDDEWKHPTAERLYQAIMVLGDTINEQNLRVAIGDQAVDDWLNLRCAACDRPIEESIQFNLESTGSLVLFHICEDCLSKAHLLFYHPKVGSVG